MEDTKRQQNNRNEQRPRRGRRNQRKSPILQEFDQKILDIARVTRVTAGGRRFSFRVTIVIGDNKGRVGVGVDKGKDVPFAIEKAARDAKNNMIRVSMTEDGTIPHEVTAKVTSSVVFLRPAKKGRGINAGGAVRAVCTLAGYTDITTKMLGRSNNKLNNARATIKALSQIKKQHVTKEHANTSDIKTEETK